MEKDIRFVYCLPWALKQKIHEIVFHTDIHDIPDELDAWHVDLARLTEKQKCVTYVLTAPAVILSQFDCDTRSKYEFKYELVRCCALLTWHLGFTAITKCLMWINTNVSMLQTLSLLKPDSRYNLLEDQFELDVASIPTGVDYFGEEIGRVYAQPS